MNWSKNLKGETKIAQFFFFKEKIAQIKIG